MTAISVGKEVERENHRAIGRVLEWDDASCCCAGLDCGEDVVDVDLGPNVVSILVELLKGGLVWVVSMRSTVEGMAVLDACKRPLGQGRQQLAFQPWFRDAPARDVSKCYLCRKRDASSTALIAWQDVSHGKVKDEKEKRQKRLKCFREHE